MNIKRVVIIGSALSGNKGAAAMLESAIQTLSDHYESTNIQFTLLSMYPVEDASQNPYDNLTIVDASPFQLGVVINTMTLLYRLLPFTRSYIIEQSDAVRALVEADVLLDQGGITFVDGREKFLLYNTASILPAFMVRTPVIKCAQALGPFKKFINKHVARLFLPRVAKIVSRGVVTQKYLTDLGLKNTIDGADYSFLLDVTAEEATTAKKAITISTHKKVIGISPSVVMQKKVNAVGGDYNQEIIDFSKYLISQNYDVVLIPHSARSHTTKSHNNDLPLCRSIYERISDTTNCTLVEKELSSQQLRFIIGTCDYFVTSRFHAMISSLAMEVPTLVIGWSHKYREVLEMFTLEDYAFGHDKLQQDYLRKQFHILVANESDVKQKLRTHLPEVKEKAKKQVDAIVHIIDQKEPQV